MANALASDTFDHRRTDLLPHTRRLLAQLHAYVHRRADEEEIPWSRVRFTQRQIREALHWRDHALRRQLKRLVQLEYVVAYRTGRGNQRAYQSVYDGPLSVGAPLRLGLTDAEQLRGQDTSEGSGEPLQRCDSRGHPAKRAPCATPFETLFETPEK